MQDSENPSPVRMKYLYGKYGKYFLLFQLLPWEIKPRADSLAYGKQSKGG